MLAAFYSQAVIIAMKEHFVSRKIQYDSVHHSILLIRAQAWRYLSIRLARVVAFLPIQFLRFPICDTVVKSAIFIEDTINISKIG